MEPPDEEDSTAPSVGDTTLKHTDIDDYAGGSSRLGKASVGSSALTAALTLHPCVYVTGCGSASKGVLHQIFSQAGPCTVSIVEPDPDDEDENDLKGEASVTFGEAAHAVLAIQRFDGTPFDDGTLSVSVSRNAAQGSLTRRGRGRNADKLTHHDRQQMLMGQQRVRQAQNERDAFTAARSAALAASARPTGPRPTVLQPGSGPSSEGAAKRQKGPTGLPKCCVVAKSSSSASSSASKEPSAASPVAAPAPSPSAAAGSAGALLGLGGYESSDDGGGSADER
tara:strand:- start:949 stop:1794 length:846 start_codon:yes stop_codon:yes gene_type:complete